MTGGSAVGPEGPQAVAPDQARAGRLHADAADRAHRRQRPAQLRSDPEHAAALRDEHDRAACSRTSTTRTRTSSSPAAGSARPRPPGPGVRAGREPAAGFREDPRRQPDGEREGVRARERRRRRRRSSPTASRRPRRVQRTAQIAKPITFDGTPQLKPIEGTTLQYVANASTPIIMTGALRVLRVPERHLVLVGRR